MQVALTPAEWSAAYAAGLRRHAHHCERKGRRPTEASLRLEGIGCVAEYAAARTFGGSHDFAIGAAHYGGADVVVPGASPIEVKATEYAHGRLFVYRETDPNALVVLATVDTASRTVTLRGWIEAAVAKDPAHWTDRRLVPCFEWTQGDLNPMETFPCLPVLPPSLSPTDSPPPVTPDAIASNPAGG